MKRQEGETPSNRRVFPSESYRGLTLFKIGQPLAIKQEKFTQEPCAGVLVKGQKGSRAIRSASVRRDKGHQKAKEHSRARGETSLLEDGVVRCEPKKRMRQQTTFERKGQLPHYEGGGRNFGLYKKGGKKLKCGLRKEGNASFSE